MKNLRKVLGRNLAGLAARNLPADLLGELERSAARIAKAEAERIAAGRPTISYAEFIARRNAKES